MHVSIAIVRALVEELEVRGHQGPDFLRSVGLDGTKLEDPLERIDIDDYVRVVDAALSLTNDPRLGLAIGARAPAATVHVVSHAVLACRTLRDAWEFFSRFAPLFITDGRFELRERGGISELVYDHPIVPPHLEAYDAEFCLAMIHQVAHTFVPTATSSDYALHFRHHAPSDVSIYQRTFGGDVQFGQAENALVGDARMLDVPQRHTDPLLHGLLRRHAEQMLSDLGTERHLPTRIRHLVRASDRPAALDAADVAQELGLPVHTLRRHLRRDGRSVRGLVDDTIRELACDLLENAHAPIKEIAYQLGFSEPSAFHRAFKRWTGTTPAEFRTGRIGAAAT